MSQNLILFKTLLAFECFHKILKYNKTSSAVFFHGASLVSFFSCSWPRYNKDWDFAGKRPRDGVPDRSLGIAFLLRI